ncbi:unnamed protein product [Larinioides sclopetarius]|uniref:Uncharacterized protein n=1 Tax=Larinioides sclopetarius TaxID=280406 RepID=A0AAV2BTA5_9ARAC
MVSRTGGQFLPTGKLDFPESKGRFHGQWASSSRQGSSISPRTREDHCYAFEKKMAIPSLNSDMAYKVVAGVLERRLRKTRLLDKLKTEVHTFQGKSIQIWMKLPASVNAGCFGNQNWITVLNQST